MASDTPVPPEFEELRDRARRNEASAPRKHHVVPKSYLRRWAERSLIRVTEVESRATYTTAPGRAARITDFYRVEADELDPNDIPPLLFETLLGEVEVRGKAAIDELLTEPPEFHPKLMADLAWFLGFQYTRGNSLRREMRFMSNELFKKQYARLTDEGLRHVLSRDGKDATPEGLAAARNFLEQLRNGTATVEPQDAMLVGYAGQTAQDVGEQFLMRPWIVYRTPPFLLTCDEPVVTVGGPGFPRGERAGVATAGVILFPLSPNRLLVMMRGDLALAHGLDLYRDGRILYDELDRAQTVEVCREIVMNADRWAFEQPKARVAAQFMVPPLPQSAAMEEVGPITEDGRDGVIFRNFRVSRWAHRRALLSWPVSEWWHPLWKARKDTTRSLVTF